MCLTQTFWPGWQRAQFVARGLHIWPGPLLPLLSIQGVRAVSGEVPASLAWGCLPMQGRGFSLRAFLSLLAVWLAGVGWVWGADGQDPPGGVLWVGQAETRRGKQPPDSGIKACVRVPSLHACEGWVALKRFNTSPNNLWHLFLHFTPLYPQILHLVLWGYPSFPSHNPPLKSSGFW